MSGQHCIKIIRQLKLYKQVKLKITDFLYILNHLLSNGTPPLKHVKRFILDNYQHDQIQWKGIADETLEQMQKEQLQFIAQNVADWKVLQQEQQDRTRQFIQQKSQIRKVLKQRNINKQELILIYQQEIRINQANLVRNNTVKPIITSSQQKKNNQHTERQNTLLNIKSLKRRINIMEDSLKFDLKDDQALINQRETQYLIRQQQLKNIINQFGFKKEYFNEMQKNVAFQQIYQLTRKITIERKAFGRRLRQLFLHYSSQNFDSALSFQRNNQKLIHMDLRLFLKFIKDIKQSSSRDYFGQDQQKDKIFKPQNLTILFRKHQTRLKQIDFTQFQKISYQLFLGADKPSSKQGINGEQAQKMQHVNSKQIEQLQHQHKRLKLIKQTFFNKNISKILNIYNSSGNFQDLAKQKVRKLQKTSTSIETKSANQLRQSRLQKIIDKSMQDYEATKKYIHDTFMKRSKKTKAQLLQAKLSSPQNVKIMVSKNKEGQIKILKNRKILAKRTPVEMKAAQNQGIQSYSGGLLRQPTPFNKNIFEQIIFEAANQSQNEESIEIQKRQLKSKSTGNLLELYARKGSKIKLRSYSSKKARSESTTQLKQIFTLPKITRMSQQRLQNQSIVKTLDYLYEQMGKKQEPKIKKILELDNPQFQKANAYQNQYLREYFDKQRGLNQQERKTPEETKQRKLQIQQKKCHKFREDNYQKFMKFS